VTYASLVDCLYPGTVTIADNSAGSPHTVPLVATGTFIVLNHGSLGFDTVAVGSKSAPLSIKITAFGTQPLLIGTITPTGPFSQTNNCPPQLAVGTSCPLRVTFSPTAAGPVTGDFQIANSDNSGPNFVRLTGTGQYARKLSCRRRKFAALQLRTRG